MFEYIGEEFTNELENGNYTYNWHTYGIRPSTFANDQQLNDFWFVTSTSISEKNEEFVATIEAKKYPIMATQFHPEMVFQSFNDNFGINHSRMSRKINQKFMELFVKMTRQNKLTVSDEFLE